MFIEKIKNRQTHILLFQCFSSHHLPLPILPVPLFLTGCYWISKEFIFLHHLWYLLKKIIAYFDLSIKTEPNTDGRGVIVSIIQQTYQLNNYIDKLSNYQIIFKSRYSAWAWNTTKQNKFCISNCFAVSKVKESPVWDKMKEILNIVRTW